MNFGGHQPTSAFGQTPSAFESQATTNPVSSTASQPTSFRGGYSGRARGAAAFSSSFRGGRGGGFANKTYIAPGLQQGGITSGGGGNASGGNMNDLDMDTSDQQQGFAFASRGRGRSGASNVGRGGSHASHDQWSTNNMNQNASTNAFGAPSVRGRKQGLSTRSLQWRADDAQKNNMDTNDTTALTTSGGGSTFSNMSSSLGSETAATGSAFSAFGGDSGGSGMSLSTSGAQSTFGSGLPSAFSTGSMNTNNISSGGSSAFSTFGNNNAGSSSTTSGTAFAGRAPSNNNNAKAGNNAASIFNQDDADSRLARFSAVPVGNRYEELKEKRVIEREQAIRSGAIPDPNKPRRLEDAIQFIGTCLDMCPEFERHEREYQQSLEKFEKIPGTESVDHARAVKAFARPAAGADQPLPSDVRPPHVLLKSLAYLVQNVIDERDLLDSHSFIRDRTRSIRQDFTLQNNRSVEAVKAHEIIARYHILCLHQLCEEEGERFSQQQEMEQLRKVLTSLQEFYDDLRSENIFCENEAEFRAYHILSHLHDPDMLRQAQHLPLHLFNNPFIRIATEIQYLTRRNNDFLRRGKVQSEASPNFYSRFFKMIAGPTTSYLFACLLEVSFVDIRKGALKAMNKAYLEMHGGYPADELVNTLGFDDLDECITTCQEYGLEVDTSKGRPMIIFGRRDPITRQFVFQESTIPLKQHRNLRIVEAKRAGWTATQIIYGDAPPPRLKGVKGLRIATAPPAQPGLVRLNPAAPTFTPGAGLATKPLAISTTASLQAPTSAFGRGVQATQPSAFAPQGPTAKPVPPPSAPAASLQLVAPKQPTVAPAFNFGVPSATVSAAGTTTASVPPASTSGGFSNLSFPNPQAASLTSASALATTVPATTLQAPLNESSAFRTPAFPSTQPTLTFASPQPIISAAASASALSAAPGLQMPSTTLSSAPPMFSFQPPGQGLAQQAPYPSTLPTLSQDQPAAAAAAARPPMLFSTTLAAPAPSSSLVPAPIVPQKPKSDATRVVAASGMIYPRSTVEQVLDDLLQVAVSGFVRTIVVEAQHDERLDRSMAQNRLRQQRIRQESLGLRDRTVDYGVRLLVSELVAEVYREHQLSQWAIGRWKRFTEAARRRRMELQRRQWSFLQNVQAMSSRAGLGEDPARMQLKAYQEEQRRAMRRYGGGGKDGGPLVWSTSASTTSLGVASAAASKASAATVKSNRRHGGDGGDGVKALVLATWQRQQQMRAEKIKEVGDADQAMVQQFEVLSAPKRERWAALDVSTIVQKSWRTTHAVAMANGQAEEDERSLSVEAWRQRWILQVHTPSVLETGSQWIFSKLGVQIQSQSRMLYKEHRSIATAGGGGGGGGMDVIIYGTDEYSVADLLRMSKNTIAETSAFLFVFSNIPFTEDEATEDSIRLYWEHEHSRLTTFLSCFPKVCQPIVFVMWGQSKTVWETMSPRMIEYLRLDQMVGPAEAGSLILAYQLIFMTTNEPNPGRFIEGSLDWLAKASRVVEEDPQAAVQELFNKFQPYYEGTLARMSVSQAPMYSQYEADKADSAFYEQYNEPPLPNLDEDEEGGGGGRGNGRGDSNNLFVETVESALELAVKNFNLLLDHVAAIVESTGSGDGLREGAQQEKQVKQGIVRLVRAARLPVVVHGRFLEHIGFDLDARESFCDYVDRYVSNIGGVAKDLANATALKHLRNELRAIVMRSRVDRTPIFEVTKLLTATVSQWIQQAILKQWGAERQQDAGAGAQHRPLAFSHWLVGDEVDVEGFVSQYEKMADQSVHAWEGQVMDRVAKYDERADFIKTMKQLQARRAATAAAAAALRNEELDADLLEDDELGEGEADHPQQRNGVATRGVGGLKRNAPVDVDEERDKRAKTLANLALLAKATAAASSVALATDAAAAAVMPAPTGYPSHSNHLQQAQQQPSQLHILSAFGSSNKGGPAFSTTTQSNGNYSFAPDVHMSLARSRRGSTASMASVSSVLTTHSTSSKRDDLITRLSNRIKEVKSTILQKS
ncbi:hypothetical protein BGZ73_007569 [Actinomortierella ambigua]|nr:hypothetical protein BGZ73_007569 [Actinomortierella ambigua]